MADSNKGKEDLGLLEEDDEFEEFPTESYEVKVEEEAAGSVWDDGWDDDQVEDDFSKQLRSELEKAGKLPGLKQGQGGTPKK